MGLATVCFSMITPSYLQSKKHQKTNHVDISCYIAVRKPRKVTDLVLGSRSVGFTSATFFSQSKVSQSTLNCPRSTMPYRVSKNCLKLLDMTQTCPTKMLKIVRNDPSWLLKIVQNCSRLLKNCSKLLKIAQNASKCFKMSQNGQQVSKGVMCLHMQVRKLSLLGIAVAGVFCCMGLRSVSIAPGSSQLLRSDPSIVNFN